MYMYIYQLGMAVHQLYMYIRWALLYMSLITSCLLVPSCKKDIYIYIHVYMKY